MSVGYSAFRRLLGVMILGWAGLIGGCKPLEIAKSMPWSDAEAKAVVPTRMEAIWSETTLHQSGQPPVRGFGGRIMFYEDQEGAPVVVDGTLTVYAFDESNAAGADVAPARKYVFTPDQLPKHYSQSALGHSYSVWIPWDEAGCPPERRIVQPERRIVQPAVCRPPRQFSLVARFDATQGGIVLSDHAKQLLPGVTPQKSEERRVKSEVRRTKDEEEYENADAFTVHPSPFTLHSSGVVQAAHEAARVEPITSVAKPTVSYRRSTLRPVPVPEAAGAPTEGWSAAGRQIYADDRLREKPPFRQDNPPVRRTAAKESMTTVTIDIPASFVRQPIDVNGLSAEAAQRTVQATEVWQSGQRRTAGGERPVAAGGTGGLPASAIGPGLKTRVDEWPVAPDEWPVASGKQPPLTTDHLPLTPAQSGRFVRPRFPVRRVQSARPDPDRLRRQPYPATWPSALPPTPRLPQSGNRAGEKRK